MVILAVAAWASYSVARHEAEEIFSARLATLARVLQALVASGQTGAVALAIFAVMMSLIGAFYYLRVIVYLFMRDPVEPPVQVAEGAMLRAGLLVAAIGTVALGLAPTPIIEAVIQALAT